MQTKAFVGSRLSTVKTIMRFMHATRQGSPIKELKPQENCKYWTKEYFGRDTKRLYVDNYKTSVQRKSTN